MKIKNIRITNYKSILDSGVVELSERFTVIVGQNNAGKTAFLERFNFVNVEDRPHRSSRQDRFHIPSPHSTTEIEVSMSGAETRWAALASVNDSFIPYENPGIRSLKEEADEYFAKPEINTQLIYDGRGWRIHQPESHTPHIRLSPNENRRDFQYTSQPTQNNSQDLIAMSVIPGASFVFRAERLNVGTSNLQPNAQLRPDASNLAGVLGTIQGRNHALFEELNAHINTILPTVKRVGVVPTGEKEVTLHVWNEAPKATGPDLGFPLDDCGTGVGQILALLTVAMTYQSGRLIVIDEPNSFLHPRAVRELIRILKLYSQHQYIISTHAAEVIAATEPEKLVLVRWDDTESKISVQNGDQISHVRSALDDVGSRLSDVFGYDEIVWVEGPTEAACFPKIALAAGIALSRQPKFVSIINTGDLESKKRDAKLVWRVYERLSQQSILMPQTIAFSLDREGRSPEQQKDLSNRSNGLVHFLPRRAFENYLLHPAALVAIMPTLGTVADVATWLSENGGEPSFQGLWNGDITDPIWIATVDAANLLTRLFADKTATKEEYRKTTHSVALTEWLISNDWASLQELASYIVGLKST